MMLGVVKKQPGDTLDYDVDFSRWLPEGDSLLSASVAPVEGLTIDDVEVVPPLVKVWLSGGTHGASYTVEITAITSGGRTKEVCFRLRVVEC